MEREKERGKERRKKTNNHETERHDSRWRFLNDSTKFFLLLIILRVDGHILGWMCQYQSDIYFFATTTTASAGVSDPGTRSIILKEFSA